MQIGGSTYISPPPLKTDTSVSAPALNPASITPSTGLAAPTDRVEISTEAIELASNTTTVSSQCADCAAGSCTTCKKDEKQNELSEEEQTQVEKLKERDAEVRAHEAAHAATGGAFAGGASYEYQVGPDGKRYAIGGEVKIDASPIDGDPAATIDKLRTVQAAALAPAEPSGQDKKVAAQAAAAIREAEAELLAEKQAELRGDTDPATPANDAANDKGAPQNENAPSKNAAERDFAQQQQIQIAASAYQRTAALA